jgi:hypothetical protein
MSMVSVGAAQSDDLPPVPRVTRRGLRASHSPPRGLWGLGDTRASAFAAHVSALDEESAAAADLAGGRLPRAA